MFEDGGYSTLFLAMALFLGRTGHGGNGCGRKCFLALFSGGNDEKITGIFGTRREAVPEAQSLLEASPSKVKIAGCIMGMEKCKVYHWGHFILGFDADFR